MAISEQGKKVWKTQQGGNLMRAMLTGSPLTQQDKQTLEQLKQGDTKPQSQGATDSQATSSARTEQPTTSRDYPMPTEGVYLPEQIPDRYTTGKDPAEYKTD